MAGPRSRLPSLDDGVAFAKGVARVLSEITGDPYGEPALSELEAGKEKAEQGLGNPVAFAHTVIDWYAQATGDFLYGTGEVSRESYNLALIGGCGSLGMRVRGHRLVAGGAGNSDRKSHCPNRPIGDYYS